MTHPIVAWYGERGILLSVDGMRPVAEVSRDILAALDGMHQGPPREVDLASLGAAFGHVSQEVS